MTEIEELIRARDKLKVAQNHFEYADNAYIDIAVEALRLAELRYNLLIKRYCISRR